jgi:hypothetical protein
MTMAARGTRALARMHAFLRPSVWAYPRETLGDRRLGRCTIAQSVRSYRGSFRREFLES